MVQGSVTMAQSWHGHFEPKRVPEGVWMRCDGCQAREPGGMFANRIGELIVDGSGE